MKKLNLIKRVTALLLCAVFLCVPLLGMGAVADSDISIGDSAEPFACFCDVLCTATTLNADCVVCAADLTACKGKPPEPPTPICACTVKCAAGAVNADCPVCKADSSGCIAKAAICACTVKCAAGAVNSDCSVCKLNLAGCVGKEIPPPLVLVPNYNITILSPSGWYTKTANVEIRVEDVNETGWNKVEVKLERSGSWLDLTDDLTDRNSAKVEITENCTVYVTVTDKAGKAHTKSRYIECFDRIAPTLRAGIDGKLLRAEATDDLSGVDAIYVDGDRYTDLTNGVLDMRLRDLDDDYEQISISAVDYAGNKSKTIQLKNPAYNSPEDKKKEDDKKETTSSTPTPAPTPAPTPPAAVTKPPAATTSGGTSSNGGTSSKPVTPADPKPLTPDGTGTVIDSVTDEDGKEFYTIMTPAENVFYLVIDRQRDADNVYFLNAVTESDLLALAEVPADEVPEAAIPEPVKCSCKTKCAAGAVDTKCPVCIVKLSDCEAKEQEPTTDPVAEEQPKKSNTGMIVIVLLVVLGAGGAGYYFKIMKPKKELDDADDFDEIQFEDSPTVTEDEPDALPEPEKIDEPETAEMEDDAL